MAHPNQIAKVVIDLAFYVHTKAGPGLFESVYCTLLCFELQKRGFAFTKEQAIPLIWENIKLEHGFRSDIIVEKQVLIEIKSIDAIAPVHKKQVLTYLKLSGIQLGLLLNFNVGSMKEGIYRIVNNLDEDIKPQ